MRRLVVPAWSRVPRPQRVATDSYDRWAYELGESAAPWVSTGTEAKNLTASGTVFPGQPAPLGACVRYPGQTIKGCLASADGGNASETSDAWAVNLAVSCWVYVGYQSGVGENIVGRANAHSDEAWDGWTWNIGYTTTQGVWRVGMRVPDEAYSNNPTYTYENIGSAQDPLSVGTWHHLGFRWQQVLTTRFEEHVISVDPPESWFEYWTESTAGFVVYLDGRLVATVSTPHSFVSTGTPGVEVRNVESGTIQGGGGPLMIGGASVLDDNYLYGSVQGVRVAENDDPDDITWFGRTADWWDNVYRAGMGWEAAA